MEKAEGLTVKLEAECQIMNDCRVQSTETFRHKYSWQHDELMKLRQKLAIAGVPADTTTLRPQRSQSAYLARSPTGSPRSPSRAVHGIGPNPSAPMPSPHYSPWNDS